MCKAVNIPALKEHNSLKALGGVHTGKGDPNHAEAFFAVGTSCYSQAAHNLLSSSCVPVRCI